MSNHKRPPVLEIGEGRDTAAVSDKLADKSNRSGVAQVAVYHDDWEELDLESQEKKAKPTQGVKPKAWAKEHKRMLTIALVGTIILALALGLGLGLGLKKPNRGRPIRRGAAPTGNVTPAASEDSTAGTTVSNLEVSDADQLRSLMQLKAALDTTGILKGQWTESAGKGYKYCSWKYIVCDAGGRVVEGLNLTTDTYEVVFSGKLPPASAFKGLPGLREIDIRLHLIKGPLPDDWSELQQLEVVRLDQNNLAGELPASWSNLNNLRVLSLWDNKLTGPLPDSWGNFKALEILDVSYNRLTGPLPAKWSKLPRLQRLMLDVNQLTGQLPEEWAALTNMKRMFLSENEFKGPLPESWARLTQLTDFFAEYNKLSGALPESWGDLGNLERLSLNDNAFIGSIPSSWEGMAQLNEVYLYNNPKLGGCLPALLKDQLGKFSVKDYVTEGTQITGFCKA